MTSQLEMLIGDVDAGRVEGEQSPHPALSFHQEDDFRVAVPVKTIDLHIEPKAVKHSANSHALTYKNRDVANADRNQQVRLLDILDAGPSALRRDECGAWRVSGSKGHAYTWGDGETWVAYVAPGSARKWTKLKQRLSFCQVTQNGDDEGCLRFGQSLPAEQGRLLRKAIGLRKRHSLTPETTKILGSAFMPGKLGVSAPRTAETTSRLHDTPPAATKAAGGETPQDSDDRPPLQNAPAMNNSHSAMQSSDKISKKIK